MSIFTAEWWKAAGIRAIKTFAEGAIAVIGTQAMFIQDVNWFAVLSGGAMAAIVSFLISLKGLPELKEEEDTKHAKHFEG
jgi:hypothetical protein